MPHLAGKAEEGVCKFKTTFHTPRRHPESPAAWKDGKEEVH